MRQTASTRYELSLGSRVPASVGRSRIVMKIEWRAK